MGEMIEKIKKMQEALHKPQPPGENGITVSYGSASSVEEEIGRRMKKDIVPKLIELCDEVERCYNMYSYGFEDAKEAKAREKMLKPLEKVYNNLKASDDLITSFIETLASKKD